MTLKDFITELQRRSPLLWNMRNSFRVFLFVLWAALFLPQAAPAGTVREFHPGGKIHVEKEVDENGQPHGTVKEYGEDGTLLSERRFAGGVRDGISKLYYPTGELMSEWAYQNGLRNGISLGYYKNGKVKDRGAYLDDKLEGVVKMYHPNGSLKAEMNFKNDRQDGMSKTYYESGKLQHLYKHKGGRLLNRKTYGEDGGLAADQDFPFPEALP